MQTNKIMLLILSFVLVFGSQGCQDNGESMNIVTKGQNGIELIVLGIAQDGGVPHANCNKICCADKWNDPEKKRNVVSLGLLDHENEVKWLLEATPDISDQLHNLSSFESFAKADLPNGIFLTHAHIGHYTGLMYLGREVVGARNIPVYIMPRMKQFLENNGPWNQLVELDNIQLVTIERNDTIALSEQLNIIPFLVPHRDEYSETVGFKINGPNLSVLFIPDINKWEIWEKDIISEVRNVDLAFIDGTFYDGNELPNRDMSEIPHPFMIESMEIFKDLSTDEKKKIYFIHLNHTNPVLDKSSREYQEVIEMGFQIAEEEMVFEL